VSPKVDAILAAVLLAIVAGCSACCLVVPEGEAWYEAVTVEVAP
jgi:hypothetical protein